ncbi:MAG: metal-sulfur cluster assembly factor [Bacteroidota bacterium]
MDSQSIEPNKGKEFIEGVKTDIMKNVLSQVMDPEIEIDIVNLGLIYGIEFDGINKVDIVMTMSTPACPLSDAIMQDVRESIMRKYNNFTVNVELVFEPLWHSGMISEEGKEMLGM